MADGWIRLHRQLIDSSVFAHPIALKVWIWCLCKASFKDRHITVKIGKGDSIVNIKQGQFIFGRFKAEEELGIDGSTIYKWMRKFSDEMEMISIESNNQYSIITILNFNDFQENEDTEKTTKEQPSSNQVTGKEQPRNTYKKVNNVKESIEIYGDIESKYYIISNPKYVYQNKAKIYGVSGLKAFLQLAQTDLPCTEDEALKFMRAKDKCIYDGDQGFIVNSIKIYLEKQYA